MADGFRIATAWVSVSPDTEGFEEDLKAKLDAATAGAEARVRITGDDDELDAILDRAVEKLAGIDGLEARARITADDDELSEVADRASARLDELDGKTARPRLDLEDGDFRRRLAEDEAEASSFGDSSFHPLIAAATAGITASLPGIGGALTGLGALGGAGALAFGGIASAVEQAGQATQSAGQTSAQLASTEFSNSVAIQQSQQSVAQARQQSARDAITSAQQVASAQQQLVATQRDAAAQQVQALESVADADHQVGQAQYTLTEAQYSYNQAVVQARDNITALNDALADQKLSVKSAALAVQQAEYQQQQTDQNAFSTALDRQQAALAVAQAQQQQKDATDQLTVAQQNANQADQQGVQGSQTVIQSKNALSQAQYGVTQAQQAYADAQSALTRTELDDAAQVKAAQQAVASAQQQQAWQAQSDAQSVASAQQQLTDTVREQQLQMAATGGAASTLASDMAQLSPQARQAADEIIGMKGALHDLEDTAQAAVLPGFTLFLQGAQSLLPEIEGGIAAVGQGLGNSFAQAGQEMESSGVERTLDGLVENGIVFDRTVLPALSGFAGALADAGAQKGAVDGLADGIAGIADGLSGVVHGVEPFEAGVDELLSSVGTIADAAGKPLGTLVGVLATGLSPALQALDPVILQVGGDLSGIFLSARPVLAETGQIIGDLSGGTRAFATVLSGSLEGALRAVGFALQPVDAFLSSSFGRGVADEVGFILPALGAWKLANSALGLGSLVQGIGNAVTVTKGLAVAEGEAAAAGSFGWIAGAVQGIRDFAVATEGATLAERALLAAEVTADALNPFGWVALGIGAVAALALALDHTQDSTESYITTLSRQDDATGYNIAGYQKLAGQLAAAAGEQEQVNNAVLYSAQYIPAASSAVTMMKDKVTDLTAAQRQAAAEAASLTGSLGTLESQYGLTATQAEQLAGAAGVQAKTLASGGSAAQSAMGKIEAYAQANLDSQGTVRSTSQDFATLANNTLTASDRTGAMDDAYQALVGNFVSSQQTQLQVQSDFLTLASNAQQAGASMGGTNQASNELAQSFYTTLSDIHQHIDAMQQEGDTEQQVRAYVEQVTAKLQPYTKGNQAAATAVQGLTGFVDGLSASLKKMPKKEQVGIGVTATGSWNVTNAGLSQSTAHAVLGAAATGGLITGPGGPTDDVIPILASNREYVVNAAAVSHYGAGLFEALNAQKLATGGAVTGTYSGSVQGLPAWDSRELSATTTALEGSVAASFAQGASTQSVNVPGTTAEWIAQGMKIAGVSGADWQSGLAIIAMGESGGSQSAVNRTDANARAGTPSAGLMQFIEPTFARYAKPGYQVWMNPVDQVIADAWPRGYITEKYGGIDNVPGVKAVRAGGQYTGYDSGGWLPPGASPAVNQTGQPEAVLTPQESQALITVARQFAAMGGKGGALSAPAAPVVNVNYYGPQEPTQEMKAAMMRELALLIG